MGEEKSSLIEIINNIIDKNDPTQKAIGLLAVLVDTRINQVIDDSEKQTNSIIRQLKDVDEEQDNLSQRINAMERKTKCPLGTDERLKELQQTIEPVVFVNKYPKFLLLMLIGIMALGGIGVKELVSQIINILK